MDRLIDLQLYCLLDLGNAFDDIKDESGGYFLVVIQRAFEVRLSCGSNGCISLSVI